MPKGIYLRPSPEDRFWAKVRKGGPDDCWLWTAGTDKDGYGRFMWNMRNPRSHRVAYELLVGPIPEGLYACHTCDNPPCCNPAHIFLGTQLDNIRDAASKGRLATGNCTRTKGCPGVALSPADVQDIRSACGKSNRVLARHYGVHPSTISRARRMETWKHVI